MFKKLNIAVIFGGKSGEHEVSLVSATSIIKNLDKKKYKVIPIGIAKTGLPRRNSDEVEVKAGEWFTGPDILNKFKNGLKDRKGLKKIIIDPVGKIQFVRSLTSTGSQTSTRRIDVAFPILHGTFGEDGTIQGLFEIMNIPYVGAGVLGSAIGMDKIVQKKILRQEKLPVVNFLEYSLQQAQAIFPERSVSEVEGSKIQNIVRRIGFPCFVKPANLGSSVGISKARNLKELKIALHLAKKYDNKIIIEEAVPNTREFECAVLGNAKPRASAPGEVIASNEFYDYDAKYVDGKSKTVIPAPIPKKLEEKIKNLTIKSYKAINCEGMARVDFLYDSKAGRLYINELNTIPGFTQISMYPKLWIHSGLKYSKLLGKLIGLAMERHKNKQKVSRTFKPSKKWYK